VEGRKEGTQWDADRCFKTVTALAKTLTDDDLLGKRGDMARRMGVEKFRIREQEGLESDIMPLYCEIWTTTPAP